MSKEDFAAMAQQGGAVEITALSSSLTQTTSIDPAPTATREEALNFEVWAAIGAMVALLGGIVGGLIWLIVTGRFHGFVVGSVIFCILLWLFPIRR